MQDIIKLIDTMGGNTGDKILVFDKNSVFYNGDFLINKLIHKDKIKAKIEQLKKQKENVIEEVNFKSFYRITDLKEVEIKVLQDLLEE